jgi:hypothetical protein
MKYLTTGGFLQLLYRIERVVFLRLADSRINHLFALVLAFRAVLRRKVDVLKPAPAAYVQAEDIVEILSLLTIREIREDHPHYSKDTRVTRLDK